MHTRYKIDFALLLYRIYIFARNLRHNFVNISDRVNFRSKYETEYDRRNLLVDEGFKSSMLLDPIKSFKTLLE